MAQATFFYEIDTEKIVEAIQSNGIGFEDGMYYVPNSDKWVPRRRQTSAFYSRTDEKGRTQTVEAPIDADGTVHVSKEAFDFMMRELGFRATGGTLG